MSDIKLNRHEEISFTKEVKEEITLIKRDDINERKALLSAFIKINGNILVRNGKLYISIKTENKKTARLIYGEIKKLYPVQIRIIVSEKKKLRIHEDSKVIFIEICDEDKLVLNDLHIYTMEDGFRALPPLRWISDVEMKKALTEWLKLNWTVRGMGTFTVKEYFTIATKLWTQKKTMSSYVNEKLRELLR